MDICQIMTYIFQIKFRMGDVSTWKPGLVIIQDINSKFSGYPYFVVR
jgi:hypothetical protein